jgi:16S rRNA (cytidine1402-2'-O)-methyltransferase
MSTPDSTTSQGSAHPGPSKLAPGLHLVATPIGNLGDLSPRAVATLAEADLILAEDTRISVRLLQHAGIARPMTAYHEHNAARVRPEVLARLRQGARVALIADAGTPLVSDPGYKLVREAIEAGIEVFAVPGPSAVLAALVVSGLPTDRFFFQGFLPPKAGARRQVIEELAPLRATLVLFESPRRLGDTLALLTEALGPRPAAVARELTKRFEEVRRGTLAELAALYTAEGPPRGEVVLVVGGAAAAVAAEDEVERALALALATMPPGRAATEVARATGRPRAEIYRRALAQAGRTP